MEKLDQSIKEEKPEALVELTNEIPELVYIADTQTYDLLFINKAGREKFNLNPDARQKCYSVLQGRDTPCPFCTNSKLSFGETYTWEYDNPISKGHYLLKDKLIRWGGRTARMEIAFDITQQENERQELSTALAAERIVMDCVHELYDTADTRGAVDYLLQRVGEFLSADRAYLFEVYGDKMYNTLEWCADGIKPEKPGLQGMSIRLLERWIPCFSKQQCVVVEDLEQLRECSPEEYHILFAQGIRSLVAVPLENGGNLSGYIGVDNPAPDKIQNIVPLFQTLRYFIMASFHRAENEERLLRLSYYDTLTGLYNRNRFMRDTQIADPLEEIGVVQLNINGLKTINDRQGHAVGDNILADCARRMKNSFHRADYYRIGGDEFVIICRGIPHEEFEAGVRDLQEQMAVNDSCSAAIGSEWAERAANYQTLLAGASERMYNDKRHFYRMTLSADRYRHYNDDLLGLTEPGALAQALESGNFLVYFQPKIAFADRSLAGAEALVRYRMGDGTIVSPQQFIPLLEDARLISAVDFFMVDAVCALIASWRERGIRIVPTAVNFSRYTIMENDFINRLEACCHKHSVEKRLLEIEITESVEGVDGFDVKGCLKALRDAGFLVSIDDFGVRYANMYLFASARFDVLKIDKSLVDDIAANENVLMMLESLSGFCEKLSIETVAEGVETEAQFGLLKAIGIKLAQGYLFSRPIPAEQYEREYLINPEK